MKAWRRIANVILWISLIVSAIGVLVGSILLFCSNAIGYAFVVLLGGCGIVLVSHTMFGMFIELCNNVAAWGSSESDGAIQMSDWLCTRCGTANEKYAEFCSACGNKKNANQEK